MAIADSIGRQLDQLHIVHDRTNAVAWFADGLVMEHALALDTSPAGGALTGLGITVKDWIDVAGFPCHGVRLDHPRRPDRDATAVARLRRAGAVVLAKSVAWSHPAGGAAVQHPTHPGRMAGGSSTGEAVLVALHATPVGVGSDSGGSVRLPAAWCGTFGYKPTAGLVPTTGHYPRVGAMSDGRTQLGLLTLDLDLVERLLRVMAGPDGVDGGVAPVPLLRHHVAGPQPRRFAVIVDERHCTPSIAAAVEQAAGALERGGWQQTTWVAPWLDDARDITLRYWTRDQLTGSEVERQLADWDRFRSRYLRAAQGVELLLTPTVCEPAPPARDIAGDDYRYTLPPSLTGSPAVAVPWGHDGDGLPLSVQLVGRPWEDLDLIDTARMVTQTV